MQNTDSNIESAIAESRQTMLDMGLSETEIAEMEAIVRAMPPAECYEPDPPGTRYFREDGTEIEIIDANELQRRSEIEQRRYMQYRQTLRTKATRCGARLRTPSAAHSRAHRAAPVRARGSRRTTVSSGASSDDPGGESEPPGGWQPTIDRIGVVA